MVERLPIKFFSKREEDKQRVEGNSNKDLPKWVLSGDELTIKSEQLVAGFDEIITKIKWEARTVPVIMQATLNKDAHAKSHRKKIESVFATKKNNILGVGDENTLLIKVDSLEDAREMQIRLKDVDKNAYGISGIDEVKKFRALVEMADEQTNYKVRLFDFHDYSFNMTNRSSTVSG